MQALKHPHATEVEERVHKLLDKASNSGPSRQMGRRTSKNIQKFSPYV